MGLGEVFGPYNGEKGPRGPDIDSTETSANAQTPHL